MFREDLQVDDGQGGTTTVTRGVATGRKDENGNVITDARVTEFGTPAVERAGVPNRRMAFSHNFSEDELRWIEEEFIPGFPGAPGSAYLTDTLPEDWRFEETT